MISSQEIYQKLSTCRPVLERGLLVLDEQHLLVGLLSDRLAELAAKLRGGGTLTYQEFMLVRGELRRFSYVEKLAKLATKHQEEEAAAKPAPSVAVAVVPRKSASRKRRYEPLAHWDDVTALSMMWDFCRMFPQGSDEFSIAAWTQSYLKNGLRLPPADLRGKLIKIALAAGWHYGSRNWRDP